jgi:drug/metabolite transporter (DMT)-like permease
VARRSEGYRGAVPDAPRHRSPNLGYGLAAAAAAMWGLNGSLAKFLLDDGVSALRLAQMRSAVSFLLLVAVLAAVRPALLRIRRSDLPRFAFLGIAGLAGVHATYFMAIDRLPIGVVLVIQYLGPLLVLIWLSVAHGRRLPKALWGAAVLSVAGCFLVLQAWDVGGLDPLGIVFAFAAAVTFAIYLYSSERLGQRYQPATTLAYGFAFATLFWMVVQPVWTFPWSEFASVEHLALGLGVATVGTLIPFVLIVTALRHVPAARAAVVATLEPVLAALIAWGVHGQVLDAAQIAGGLLVVAAVIWVQSRPVEFDQEAAPAMVG